MNSHRTLFGFHAITIRLKTAASSVQEILFDSNRRDGRMRQLLQRAQECGVRAVETSTAQLDQIVSGGRHQGVVARVQALPQRHSLAL